MKPRSLPADPLLELPTGRFRMTMRSRPRLFLKQIQNHLHYRRVSICLYTQLQRPVVILCNFSWTWDSLWQMLLESTMRVSEGRVRRTSSQQTTARFLYHFKICRQWADCPVLQSSSSPQLPFTSEWVLEFYLLDGLWIAIFISSLFFLLSNVTAEEDVISRDLHEEEKQSRSRSMRRLRGRLRRVGTVFHHRRGSYN